MAVVLAGNSKWRIVMRVGPAYNIEESITIKRWFREKQKWVKIHSFENYFEAISYYERHLNK